MTTENVAILFTDVVGSTELSQRLSADAADEVRRGHFSILRQAIAEADGTEVKNLGDGLMVVFGSASAALVCAVAMQQGVERDNRDREYSVSLRVGLSGGEVTREDNDYFGDPVVEAARLCASCDSGQVLATAILRGMAGRRNGHECRSLGTLALKGLPDPVEIVEVMWEPLSAADTPVELPPVLARQDATRYVGRTEEFGLMDAAWNQAVRGVCHLALVTGEAGIGKTRFTSEFVRRIHGEGAVALFGRCDEEGFIPYQPLAEAMSHYVASCTPMETTRTSWARRGGLSPSCPRSVAAAPLGPVFGREAGAGRGAIQDVQFGCHPLAGRHTTTGGRGGAGRPALVR